ncbi:hypothetical protein SynWH8103_00529 [Synechococcus sp. WH 8103]|nr:hypothetical protein SynWH8103_00529 [Synechococcus sp. WH 8103]
MKVLLVAPLQSIATYGRIEWLLANSTNLTILNTSPSASINDYVNLSPSNLTITNLPHSLCYSSPQFNLPLPFSEFFRSLLLRFPQPLKILTYRFVRSLRLNEYDKIFFFYGPEALWFTYMFSLHAPEHKNFYTILNLLPSYVYVKPFRTFSLLRSNFTAEGLLHSMLFRLNTTYIVASELMQDYLYSLSPDPPPSPTYCILDTFSQHSWPSTSSTANLINSTSLSIIFLGAPQRWGGDIIDNIEQTILDLCSCGHRVTAGFKLKTAHPLFSSYPFFSNTEALDGTLSNFANKFDFALICYGYPYLSERFRSTIPTRFFASIAAGLPILLPRTHLPAVEALVLKHNLGYVYNSVSDLTLLDYSSYLDCRRSVKLFREAHCPSNQLFPSHHYS